MLLQFFKSALGQSDRQTTVSEANPLPVAVVSGGGSSGGLTDAQLRASAVLVESVVGQTAAPAAVVSVNATTAVSVAAVNPQRIELRVHNQGPGQITIGASGHTWVARVVVIPSGDTWIEDTAPAQAWFAIAAPGATAVVTVQEVLK